MIDGVKDGVIENPALCHFEPSKIMCASNVTENCLSEEQVEQLEQIYSTYTYPNGQIIYSGMQPGSEINTADGLYAGTPWQYSEVRPIHIFCDLQDCTN